VFVLDFCIKNIFDCFRMWAIRAHTHAVNGLFRHELYSNSDINDIFTLTLIHYLITQNNIDFCQKYEFV